MTWNPDSTAEDFAEGYAERSGLTLEAIHGYGRDVRPCACGEDGCHGWMMVNADEYDLDVLAFERGDGPHPGHLTADEWQDFLGG